MVYAVNLSKTRITYMPSPCSERARAKVKEKQNPATIGIGKEKGTLGNHLVPTMAKAMAIASGETTVVSPTTGLRGVKGSQLQWQPKSPRKGKRSR
jgi:hypothetical protein